jgi:hypothetical protein
MRNGLASREGEGGEERGGGCAANNFGDPFVFFFGSLVRERIDN